MCHVHICVNVCARVCVHVCRSVSYTCLHTVHTHACVCTCVCACVKLQGMFTCVTELRHQWVNLGLEGRGLLGPQLGSQLLIPLHPLCTLLCTVELALRLQQVVGETQRTTCCVILSYSDGLDIPILWICPHCSI